MKLLTAAVLQTGPILLCTGMSAAQQPECGFESHHPTGALMARSGQPVTPVLPHLPSLVVAMMATLAST